MANIRMAILGDEAAQRVLSARYTSLGQVSGWGGGQVTGRWQTSTRRLSAELVVGSYFDALGVRAVSGRLLMRSDDEPSAPPTVVISERLWRSWMAAADDVGGTLHVAGQQMTIVGLAPKSFRGVRWSHVQTTDVWFPSR